MAADGSTPRRLPRLAHFAGPNATIRTARRWSPATRRARSTACRCCAPRRQPAALRRAARRSDWPRPSRSTSSSSARTRWSAMPPSCTRPADGYLDAAGVFHRERQGPSDVPVYEVTLVRRTACIPALHGAAGEWPALGGRLRLAAAPGRARAPAVLPRWLAELRGDRSLRHRRAGRRQPDSPRGRTSTSTAPLPPGGYKKGLPAARRTDMARATCRRKRAAATSSPTAPSTCPPRRRGRPWRA